MSRGRRRLFEGGKSVRFALVDAAKEFPVQRLSKMRGVSESGYFTWRGHPARRR